MMLPLQISPVFSPYRTKNTKLRNFVLNSVFVLAILLVFGSLLGSCESDSVPEGSALVINPRGALVEQTASGELPRCSIHGGCQKKLRSEMF